MPDPSVSDSILNSTKKVIGFDASYDPYDIDITMHINSALSTLTQLGIGPTDGYAIVDASDTWDDFIQDDGNRLKLNNVKTYVYLRLKLIFDPPATHYAFASFETQVKELEWRMNVTREATGWVDPNGVNYQDILVIDGGAP